MTPLFLALFLETGFSGQLPSRAFEEGDIDRGLRSVGHAAFLQNWLLVFKVTADIERHLTDFSIFCGIPK